MSKDLNKLHYQMLRKTADSGTTMDGALSELKTKIQGDSVQPGEPVVIFYDDPSGNTGAHLAVPTSGVTEQTAEGYIFANRKEVFDRMEEDEEVTTAALIDLDDRVTTVSGDLTTLREEFDGLTGDFSEIKLKETVKAIGVSAGAIQKNKEVPSGTTFTDFVKQLLILEKDYNATNPSIAWASNATTPSSIVEVGSDVEFSTLAVTKTQGKFTGSADDGFSPTSQNAGDNFTGSTTYNFYSGATSGNVNTSIGSVSSNDATGFTINDVQEGSYRVKATHSYSSVTASGMTPSLTTNTGKPSSAKIDAGIAGTSDKIFSARYKAFLGCTSATTASEFNIANATKIESAFTSVNNTSETILVKPNESWESDGKNIFILTTGRLHSIEDNMFSTPYIGNFNPSLELDTNSGIEQLHLPLSYDYTLPDGTTKSYNLYIWKIEGNTKTEVKNVKVGN